MFSCRHATATKRLCAPALARAASPAPARAGRRALTSVVKNSSHRFPIIDFGKFREAQNVQDRQVIADEVASGFKEVGFIYLKNHGVAETQIKQAFSLSAQFFSLPSETKDQLAWTDPRANRGYVRIGQERLTQSTDPGEIASLHVQAPDYKETMEIGRDWHPTHKNKWPHERDARGFRQSMLDFFQTCHRLHFSVMRAVALGLQLNEDFFDKKIDKQYHNLRLLSYPEIKSSLLNGKGTARAGAHSDYGTVTLLFQDTVGGLEVQNPHTQEFQPAPPIPGTIVVNAGDLLARWSNDVLRSTLHRVVAPPERQLGVAEAFIPARQSIAFFCSPNADAKIECLPTCAGPEGSRKYNSVTAEEYIVGRLAETHTQLNDGHQMTIGNAAGSADVGLAGRRVTVLDRQDRT